MHKTIASTLLLLGLALTATAVWAGDPETQGFIYGTVETSRGNSYTGTLRWGTEETFWDDLFNSSKRDLPYLEEYRGEARSRNSIKILGITIGYRYDDAATSRQFVARFGDLQEIKVLRREKIEVTTRDGVVHKLDGGSNDVGATITVDDDALGKVKLDWDKIERITFKPVPSGLKPRPQRLYGKVITDDQTFSGYIQWDVQECLFTDKLDGESDDGDLSIEMGQIRAIEKASRRGSKIELKDGRELRLEGTNDVDSSMRGIWVVDERYGRVKVSWKEWERVEFDETTHSGSSYEDFGTSSALTGTVTDYEDRSHTGRLVFDLDETATWELLNGSIGDIEYSIPFAMIRSVEPQKDDSSAIDLTTGEKLQLYDGQDVSERNDGIVVVRDNDRQVYLPWDEVKRVTFN